MLIIKLTDGKENLDDMERISRHICESEELQDILTEEEREDLSLILKPTFAADHNEDEKMTHWQDLIKEFVTKDRNGEELRFIRDEKTQALYFGSREGYQTLKDINDPQKD